MAACSRSYSNKNPSQSVSQSVNHNIPFCEEKEKILPKKAHRYTECKRGKERGGGVTHRSKAPYTASGSPPTPQAYSEYSPPGSRWCSSYYPLARRQVPAGRSVQSHNTYQHCHTNIASTPEIPPQFLHLHAFSSHTDRASE